VTVADAKSKLTLGPRESRGVITLKAAPDAAPVADLPVSVITNVSGNAVAKALSSSRPVLISVVK
jgi:hypothetical protein